MGGPDGVYPDFQQGGMISRREDRDSNAAKEAKQASRVQTAQNALDAKISEIRSKLDELMCDLELVLATPREGAITADKVSAGSIASSQETSAMTPSPLLEFLKTETDELGLVLEKIRVIRHRLEI